MEHSKVLRTNFSKFEICSNFENPAVKTVSFTVKTVKTIFSLL